MQAPTTPAALATARVPVHETATSISYVEDAAWSYPEPKNAAKAITGHLAFDKRKGISVG